MTFSEMKQLDGELGRLEASAFTAGEHLAVWSDFAGASYEALSKCVGRGAMVEQLQDGRSFERALSALFAAFCRGRRRSQLVAELVKIDLQSDTVSDALCTKTPRKQDFFKTCGCQN